jgi:hypothetical protein
VIAGGQVPDVDDVRRDLAELHAARDASRPLSPTSTSVVDARRPVRPLRRMTPAPGAAEGRWVIPRVRPDTGLTSRKPVTGLCICRALAASCERSRVGFRGGASSLKVAD